MQRMLWICLVLLNAFLAVALSVVRLWPGYEAQALPDPAAALMPDHSAPDGLACKFYEPDFTRRFCQADSLIHVEFEDGQIRHTYVFTYSSGLEIGQVMQAWGRPRGAHYYSYGAVDVYWADRWAYVMTHEAFNPFNRVGYLAYGSLPDIHEVWRGYLTAPPSP